MMNSPSQQHQIINRRRVRFSPFMKEPKTTRQIYSSTNSSSSNNFYQDDEEDNDNDDDFFRNSTHKRCKRATRERQEQMDCNLNSFLDDKNSLFTTSSAARSYNNTHNGGLTTDGCTIEKNANDAAESNSSRGGGGGFLNQVYSLYNIYIGVPILSNEASEKQQDQGSQNGSYVRSKTEAVEGKFQEKQQLERVVDFTRAVIQDAKNILQIGLDTQFFCIE